MLTLIAVVRRRLASFLLALGFLSAITCTRGEAQSSARRVALVIGNSTYQHTRALPNAANDATAIGITLERIGFRVTAANNLDHRAMVDALRKFGRKAADSEMAIVFFAGHGLEVTGDNWLVPVSAELRHERDLQYEAVNLKLMLEAVAGAARLRLVILDACRNNPLGEKMQIAAGPTGAARAVNNRGLGRLEPTGDILVAYSAKHGTVAEDGPPGGNSPFAEALISALPTPGLDVRIMFGRVIDAVRARTNSRQEPFTYGSVGGAEVPIVSGSPTGSGSGGHTARASADDRVVDAWRRIEHSRDARDFNSFREQFGSANPFYAREAEKRLAAIDAEATQTAQERKRIDELKQKEDQLRARERELEEARLKLKEDELRERERRLEEERRRVAALPPPTGDGSRSASTEPPVVSGPTIWNHNGSTMRLTAAGARRRFFYDNPRSGIREEGVTSGTLLFDGTRSGDSYSGTALIFSSRCGRRAYQVSGSVSSDQRTVTMQGRAPRLGRNCETVGYKDDELVFDLLPGQ